MRLPRRDDHDRFEAAYDMPFKMRYPYGKPEFDKPLNNRTRKKINFKAPLHHLCRFRCYCRRLIREKQQTDQQLGAWSTDCMMAGYMHDYTTLWRIWDPEHNTEKAQLDVIFDDECIAYVSYLQ